MLRPRVGAECRIQRALSKLAWLVHKYELVKGFYMFFSRFKRTDSLALMDAKHSKISDTFDLIHAPLELTRLHVQD